MLGGDGFGYRQTDGRHVKIPHTGRLEVGNDVEIGANCTIDRATFEATRIGEGTKIDNLVMIGHNNQIGRHNLLCGQVGIAGSCKTGDYVIMAGQAGIKDNTQIGDRSIVGAQAGVHRNIPERPAGAGLAGDPDPRAAPDLPDDRPAARDAPPAPRAVRPDRGLLTGLARRSSDGTIGGSRPSRLAPGRDEQGRSLSASPDAPPGSGRGSERGVAPTAS